MRLLFTGLLFLILSCKGGPSDEQLQKQLSETIGASYPGVTASVAKGVVTLNGTCPDETCKTGSEASAKSVEGVKSVVNNVVISGPASPVSTPEVTADDPLQSSLTSLLSAYKGVEGKVEDGVVTLTGEIKRSQLTTLMQSVNELKPKKVVNKLVIK
ncbi:MAG TPA: BON domain-containing protein [Flavitalea sp.]|nr:BON domain-containing protein [Flavitalea sp.]